MSTMKTEAVSESSTCWCGNCGRKASEVKLYRVRSADWKTKGYACAECVAATVPEIASLIDEAIKTDVEELVRGTRFEGMLRETPRRARARSEALAREVAATAKEAEESFGGETPTKPVLSWARKKADVAQGPTSSDADEAIQASA